MSKDCYYFSHDSNAKDDPKIVKLIETLGSEGYGLFWILIETLRDQPDYKYPLDLLPALSRRYNSTFDKIKSVVMDYTLFEIENQQFFFSNSLNRRMMYLNVKREKMKLNALARWSKSNATAMQLHNKSNPKAMQVKESKVKESKVIYSECVTLTKSQYQNLITKLGQQKTDDLILRLNNYIQSSGKQYKSHYHTILLWDRNAQTTSQQNLTLSQRKTITL